MASTPNEPKSKEPKPGSSEAENSVFLHAWNLINDLSDKKSTVASVGSTANMHDVLSELEKIEEDLQASGRKKSVSKKESKKCLSGMNCVLGDDEKYIGCAMVPPCDINMTHDYAEIVGQMQKPGDYSMMDAEFPPHIKKPHHEHSRSELQNFRGNMARYRSDYRLQSPLNPSKVCSTKTPSPSISQSRDLQNRSLGEHSHVPPVVQLSPHTLKSTAGDNSLSPDNIQNQNSLINHNNININLTFAMGQYQNSEKSDPSIFCDFEELKAPRRRPTQHKPKTETSIQTDIEEMASTSLSRGISPERTDDSTSAFPSVIPSRHAWQEQGSYDDLETVVCIPETKALAWNEYIDFPAVVAYTGESMRTIIDTADHIINNFIIMPDDDLYTEEELEEGEGKLAISIMRLLGVPQQLRHSIYNEALHDVQAIQDISMETVSVINHVIDWICNGDGDGKEKLINRVRRLASVTTDFEPDSEAWSQFESEFGVFTDTVGQVMKEGYEVGAEVVRRCSETLMNQLVHKTESALALLSTPAADANGNPAGAPASRHSSSVRLLPSLPSIVEESEQGSESIQTSELEAEREKLQKLKEALNLIDLHVDFDVPKNPEVHATLNESPGWISENLELEYDSNKLHHGPDPREWKRDAFMEAPIPEPQNSITNAFHRFCDTLTNSFLDTTKNAFSSIHGSGMTPILGESQCSSRDEPIDVSQLYGNTLVEMDTNMDASSPEIRLLAAEIQKLAVLTDSYFIDPLVDLVHVPEPETECPPPPVPKRQPGTSKTVMSIDIDREILLAEDYSENTQVSATKSSNDPLTSSPPVLSVHDANHNILATAEGPTPQISELMYKLQAFWPNKALSMILTPEAQLQYAMNSFFEANGSKAEVQMSVAALKILDKPKTAESPALSKNESWTLVELDGAQVKNQKDLDNEMNDLEEMIRDLNTEVQRKQTAKTENVEPLPPAAMASLANEEVVIIDESEWEVEVPLKQAVVEPEVTTPAMVETKKSQVFHEVAQSSTVASSTKIKVKAERNSTVCPKKSGVSSRLTRIPSRLASFARSTSGPQPNGSTTAASLSTPKKPFIFGRAGIPAVPRQATKIKIINTIPFPQPKMSGVPGSRGASPQIRPPLRSSAIRGSYALGYGAQRSPSVPSRELSRTNLSRTNSYRLVFQMKQQVATGQPFKKSSAQSPTVTNDPSKEACGVVPHASTYVVKLETRSHGPQPVAISNATATPDPPQPTSEEPIAPAPAASIQDSKNSDNSTAGATRKPGFWPY